MPARDSARAVAVCCSGNGSNLQAIIGAARSGRLRARVAVVVTDNPAAYALHRALKAGIPAVVIDPRRYPSRAAFDRALARVIDAHRARWVVLAGFMRILSPWFIRRYRHRVLNVHPSLLPNFPGCYGVRDALRYGVKVTGVTVHFVDEKIDHGPIIDQQAVPVRDRDTEKTLLERVHRVEHRIYPRAIARVVSGQVRVSGRSVRVR